MEEFINFMESPETSTIRINTDAMGYLGTVFSEIYGGAKHTRKDEIFKKLLMDQLCKHSKFVLETSEKMIQNKRLGIKAVS